MTSVAPCFVVGTGRCGSTLLSNILRAHPAILSLSEFFTGLGGPKVFAREELSGRELWALLAALDPDLKEVLERADITEVLKLPADDLDSALAGPCLVTLPHLGSEAEALWAELPGLLEGRARAPVGQHFLQLFEWMRRRLGRHLWIERSGGSIEYADLLARHFPDARFIHLLRDGCASAYSMSKHPMFRVRVARLLAREPALPVARCLELSVPLDRFGAYWSALMHHTLKLWQSRVGKDRQLIMRYEDLVTNPARELARLARFVGVAAPESWSEAARAMLRPFDSHWRRLPAVQRAQLERACRPGMRILDVLGDARLVAAATASHSGQS